MFEFHFLICVNEKRISVNDMLMFNVAFFKSTYYITFESHEK